MIKIQKAQIQHITNIEDTHLLSNIPDAPKQLYVSGDLDLIFNRTYTYICIVGSRMHTEYGRKVCEDLVRSLKGYPVVIVSGLAIGIDGLVHRVALESNIPCIAVPGSGIDPSVLYPRSHVELAKEIVQNGGLLLSEYEPTQRASPWSFPMRNRIMAGLSHAVLVIEGEQDSGTLITARLALEYNRDVLAVPGSIYSETSKGPLSLIRNGAIPICSTDDLLVALKLKDAPLIRDESEIQHVLKKCSVEEISVLESLSEPRTREDLLVIHHELGIKKLEVILSMLEIRKLIEERYGKIYRAYTMKPYHISV